jgi:hypothetical protein
MLSLESRFWFHWKHNVGFVAQLLCDEGPAAVTTRGVAEHVMAAYVATKTEIAEAASAAGIDPLTDLRAA